MAALYSSFEAVTGQPNGALNKAYQIASPYGEPGAVLVDATGTAVTIENILCGWDHTVIGENIRRIQAMTPADIQRLAQKYLAREDLVTVIAGDPIPEERQAPEEKADRQ